MRGVAGLVRGRGNWGNGCVVVVWLSGILKLVGMIKRERFRKF